MGNTLLTPVQLLRESMRVFHNNCPMVRNVYRGYSDEFAIAGAKVGQTINVRKPNQYFVRTGAKINVQDTTEDYVAVSLTTQWGVDVSFTSADMTCSLDDVNERIITPAMSKLGSTVDYAGMGLHADIYNQVGSPGTSPGDTAGSAWTLSTAPRVFLNAHTLLDNGAVPRDGNRKCILNSAAHAASVDAMKALFNDNAVLSDQFKKGLLGEALDAWFFLSQNVNTLTTGTRTAGATNYVVNGTQTNRASTLLIKGITPTPTLLAGEKFTIATVYSVNPDNQKSTGVLQQFVLTADADLGSSTATLHISPPLNVAATGVADGTIDKIPTDSLALTFLSGTASTAFPQNMMFHKDAFTFATADLLLPNGVNFAAREEFEGISMRIVSQYDITNDVLPCRIDILGGWKTMRPSAAVIIPG